jgi:hypothetical protein
MAAKYKLLEKFLSVTPSNVSTITLSFEQIEMIIGNRLPGSHLDHRQWWENQSDLTNRPQAQAWTNAGFVVDEVNQEANGWVRFKKV